MSSSSSLSLPCTETFVIPERYSGLTQQNANTLFPKVKYWYQTTYQKELDAQKQNSDILKATEKGKSSRRGNARLRDGENVSMGFAEEDDGIVIDGRRAEAIRDHVKNIFNSMSALPKSWGQAGLLERQYVFNEMYRKFPFLLLCFDDWKANYIAGRCLSTYHSTNKKRLARDTDAAVKTEPLPQVKNEPAMPNLKVEGSSKRKRDVDDIDGPDSKRMLACESEFSLSCCRIFFT
jgi:hypothetical protein